MIHGLSDMKGDAQVMGSRHDVEVVGAEIGRDVRSVTSTTLLGNDVGQKFLQRRKVSRLVHTVHQ